MLICSWKCSFHSKLSSTLLIIVKQINRRKSVLKKFQNVQIKRICANVCSVILEIWKNFMWTMNVLSLLSHSFVVVVISTTFLLNKHCGSIWKVWKIKYKCSGRKWQEWNPTGNVWLMRLIIREMNYALLADTSKFSSHQI